ncbi:hypothetical protein BH09GEM1_BH09GEM1_09520 [soil metagenome]
MRRRILSVVCSLALATPAAAQTYTAKGLFLAAIGTPDYTETFETVPVAKDTRVSSFTQAGIKYTGLAGVPPNVWVASPGYNNFGAGLNPTSSSVLTSDGNEVFLIEFITGQAALGFDILNNGLGSVTTQFFNGGTLLATIVGSGAAGLSYNGYVAPSGVFITSARYTATGGGSINSGIDNLSVSRSVVVATPEPSTLPLLAGGMIAMLIARRRRV